MIEWENAGTRSLSLPHAQALVTIASLSSKIPINNFMSKHAKFNLKSQEQRASNFQFTNLRTSNHKRHPNIIISMAFYLRSATHENRCLLDERVSQPHGPEGFRLLVSGFSGRDFQVVGSTVNYPQLFISLTGLVGYSDTLGTWTKCHCNQLSL